MIVLHIRVISKGCSCAAAVLLHMCRADSSDKANQMLQIFSGFFMIGRMFRIYLTQVKGVS